jgi:glycosyltransferase involved in cell wall biosynthesis
LPRGDSAAPLVAFSQACGQSEAVNIVQITPGAGGMYCGNCVRDNALVSALRRMGHSTLMLPLYLPMTLDEADQSAGSPIFFGGVNVFLDQKSKWYRRAPSWLRRCLDTPALLRWAGGKAAKTRAEEVGDLTVSMLRGEEGNQLRELEELIGWLQSQSERPEVICLSNALLAGLARRIRTDLRAPVVCMLQGEDSFLDSLPESHRELAWNTLTQRVADVSLFIAPSRYYAERMVARLKLNQDRVCVIHNGINLEGYDPNFANRSEGLEDGPPVLGYFARMCREKGLDTLIESFIALRQRGRVPGLKLRVGGSCGPTDQPLVEQMRDRLNQAGLLGEVEFHPNLDRAGKIAFYRSISVLSVPALYGEAFGLYLLEAMAAGVPAVQPRHGAFPELIEATGGGLITEATPVALAQGIETLLLDPVRRRGLGQAAHRAVHSEFSIARVAERLFQAFTRLTVAASVH